VAKVAVPDALEPLPGGFDRPVLRDPALQEEFDRRGYVVVPLASADDVRALYDGYLAGVRRADGINPPGAYNDEYAEFSVIHSRPEFRREAYDLITSVLCPLTDEHLVGYRPLVANYVNKPPGTGVVPAHQNWSVVDESQYQSVSVWVALDDCVVANGTMLMGDGTHRTLRGPRGMWAYAGFLGVEEAVLHERLRPIEVPAGHAIVLDDAVVHYSPPNRTGDPRLAIQLVMLPAEADARFHQQVSGDEHVMEVDVWRVEPEFFFDFWHGDGDADHGEVVDRVQVAVPRLGPDDLVVDGPSSTTSPTLWRRLRSARRRRVGDAPASTSHRASADPTPLRWLHVEAGVCAQLPGAVRDLCDQRLDGLTIEGVLTPAEVDRALPVLAAARDDARNDAMFGSMLGMPLAELARIGDPTDRTPYLDVAERCRTVHEEAFGFDPRDRLAALLEPMASGWQITTPREHGRQYATGNVRWYEPGEGGLPAHAGNEFQMHGEQLFAGLRATTTTVDHLSWFIVLQDPDHGGALSVYDLVHGTYEPAEAWQEHGRRDGDFDGHEVLRVAPDPGGMVIFGGGWRYHRVDPVEGRRPRITYGGFAGPGTDGNTLNLWF
jgi:hypothetical protein